MTDPRIRSQRRRMIARLWTSAAVVAFGFGVLLNLLPYHMVPWLPIPALDDRWGEPTQPPAWPNVAPASWPPPETRTGRVGGLSSYRAWYGTATDPMTGETVSLKATVVRTGWPWRWTTEFWIRDEIPNPPTTRSLVTREPITLAMNAVAAALVGVVAGGFATAAGLAGARIRGRRRLRRGLCPMCTYPGGSSETCAECGYIHGMPIEVASDD